MSFVITHVLHIGRDVLCPASRPSGSSVFEHLVPKHFSAERSKSPLSKWIQYLFNLRLYTVHTSNQCVCVTSTADDLSSCARWNLTKSNRYMENGPEFTRLITINDPRVVCTPSMAYFPTTGYIFIWTYQRGLASRFDLFGKMIYFPVANTQFGRSRLLMGPGCSRNATQPVVNIKT